MNTVLVTGASGYLGAHVCAELRKHQHHVVSVSSSNDTACDIVCDLCDARLVKERLGSLQVDIIIHCAAKLPSKRAMSATANGPESDFNDNLAMLRNLQTVQAERIIYCSSMTVYGDLVGFITENSLGNPASEYAKSKLDCEHWLQNGQEIPFYIARLPGLFGAPRKGGLVDNTIRSLLFGEPLVLTEKLPIWSAMHVADAAETLVRLAENIATGSFVLNVGYGVPQSIFRLVRDVASLTGNSPPYTSPPDTSPPETLPPETIPLETIPLETMPLETMPPDKLELEDNWVCLEVQQQLRLAGYPSYSWYQRLQAEIDVKSS